MANLGATLTNVASSATAVTLALPNTRRQMLTIYNDSTAVLYIKCGATASSTSFSFLLQSGGYLELPICDRGVYQGLLTGIWASANGNARVTEFTQSV